MTLNEFLSSKGYTVTNIEKIYHGKDDWCRCGCGGRYFSSESTGFKRAINALNRVERDYDYQEHCGTIWVNIPVKEQDNKAYTIYFKKEGN